jgi:hypothetical protein
MAAPPTDETTELTALRAQREELHRELVRKTFRIGELEETIYENARIYEESLSWRITRPLRSLMAKLRPR